MISALFVPDGILISTYNSDTFYQKTDNREDDFVEPLHIEGLPHIVNFWNKYALVFHQMNEFTYDSSIRHIIEDVKKRWPDQIPPIDVLMPYIKKQIMDHNIYIMGVMGGYNDGADGIPEPFVYQIMGDNIRRINTDNEGKVNYNFAFLERETIFGRILREVKVQNGDQLETQQPLRVRCDIFSLKKAEEVARFALKTNYKILNINQRDTDCGIETAIITPFGLTIKNDA